MGRDGEGGVFWAGAEAGREAPRGGAFGDGGWGGREADPERGGGWRERSDVPSQRQRQEDTGNADESNTQKKAQKGETSKALNFVRHQPKPFERLGEAVRLPAPKRGCLKDFWGKGQPTRKKFPMVFPFPKPLSLSFPFEISHPWYRVLSSQWTHRLG